jgi:hypothetical protein
VDFHASDGLPHVGGDVSAITYKADLSRRDARDGRQTLVRIGDAKIGRRPLCLVRLFGVEGRNLAAVFRPDPLLYSLRRSHILLVDRPLCIG